ncbi:MAG: DUF1592 domain-containing protein [Myxococcales bacterium]|nr:DUF1592 domain-containing protein [Myxococcales bacterium]
MAALRVWWLVVLTGCSGEILGTRATSMGEAPSSPTAPTGPAGPTDPRPIDPTRPHDPTMPVDPVMPPEPLPPLFSCAAGADPSAAVVLRLTRNQYRATLADLLTRAFPAATVQTLLASTEVSRALGAIPDDGTSDRQLLYDTQDQRISTRLIEPQLDVATAVGTWVATDATRLSQFVRTFGNAAACATPTAPACVDSVVDGFGQRALRRPLDPADGDAAFYRAAYDDSTYGGYRGLIATMLMAPGFLFRTEFKGSPEQAREDLIRLSSWELASRLSYTFTGSMPDEALFAAARADFTGAGNTLAAQTDRLLSSPQARARFEQFYRQWLRLNRIPGFNPSANAALPLQDPDGLGAPLPATMDLVQFRLDAFDEQVALMMNATFDTDNGSMRDALMSQRSFARSADLARVYGVPAWNGDAASSVPLPAGQRAGLFTRAAFLLSGYPDTNPIHRGARLQVEYLCGVMDPPADTSPPAGYMPPAVPTVRNLVAAKTEIPGTACAGCHTYTINPLGFSLEQYDAFGRNRRQEPIHDGQGAIVRWERTDFTATTSVKRDGPTVTTSGTELSQALAESDRFHGCFARNVFRGFVGRTEQATTGDACVLASLQQASSSGSLKDVARALSQSREFTLRRLTLGN